jgi:hypothetical protein
MKLESHYYPLLSRLHLFEVPITGLLCPVTSVLKIAIASHLGQAVHPAEI